MTNDIFNWFEKRYPDGPQWTTKEFNCFQDAPLELRMFPMMDKLEAEISNGGLAQFLWNIFYHWRIVLEDCQSAYRLIDAAPQSLAISEFAKLCEAFEPECAGFIKIASAEGATDVFSQWYEIAEESMNSDAEELFYDDAGLDAKRSAWIKQEEALLRKLMGSE